MPRIYLVVCIVLCGSFILGCTGEMGDPEAKVAKIELKTDQFGALLATECIDMYGEEGCSRYPNPLECDAMSVSVMGDGRTCAVCNANGMVKAEACGTVGEGIPILCQASADMLCHQCVDVYGNNVLDNCNRATHLYRARSGWQNTDAAWIVEPGADDNGGDSNGADDNGSDNNGADNNGGDDNGDSTTPPSDTRCDSSTARNLFAELLNQIMSKEGLQLTYVPDLSKVYDTSHGFVTGCSGAWLKMKPYLTECWSNEEGKCHCRGEGADKSCRCARINVAALQQACNQVPEGCDEKAWEAALVMEYGVATNWIFSGTYTGRGTIPGAGYYGGLPSSPLSPAASTGPGDTAGTAGDSTGTAGDTTPGEGAPKCLGSPLVLDLDNNGIQTTSLEKGVTFDLLGHGNMNSAWVKGGDAFLVLDRNGNGIIDNGTELFGSATHIGGGPAQDGFAALSHLDHPSQGGNYDGRIDMNDKAFGNLRLWTDKNHDGVSQPNEMQDLLSAGIQSINTIKKSTSTIVDALGNDLSLRGSFTREDGNVGLMVDVLFRTGH